jgi:hypothetical protein
MWQLPSAPARTLRLLSISVLLACATGARAQNVPPPTAAELQTIQKCHDAATKADNLIAASIEARTVVTASTAHIKSLTSDASPTGAQTFTGLSAALRKLADAGLPAALTDNKTTLNNQKEELTKACGADVNAPQELIDVQAAAKTASSKLDPEASAIGKVTTSVTSALDGIPAAAGQIFDSLSGKVSDLKIQPG